MLRILAFGNGHGTDTDHARGGDGDIKVGSRRTGAALAVGIEYRIPVRAEFLCQAFLQGRLGQIEDFGVPLLLEEEDRLIPV